MTKYMNDLILYYGVAGLASMHFLLETADTPAFWSTLIYVCMWLIGGFLLGLLRIYGGASGQGGDLVDYDEDLQRSDLYLVLGAVAGMLILSTILVSIPGYAESALFVPQPSRTLSLDLPSITVLKDVLYNYTLVAVGEETVKIAFILILFRRFRKKWLSLIVVIGSWSIWHLYLSYIGVLAPIMTLAAFLSGIIMYFLVEYTESLVNTIIAHGTYNSILIVGSLLAKNVTPISSIASFSAATVALVVICGLCGHSKSIRQQNFCSG